MTTFYPLESIPALIDRLQAEIDRLAALNRELVAALIDVQNEVDDGTPWKGRDYRVHGIVSAALAKAEKGGA